MFVVYAVYLVVVHVRQRMGFRAVAQEEKEEKENLANI